MPPAPARQLLHVRTPGLAGWLSGYLAWLVLEAAQVDCRLAGWSSELAADFIEEHELDTVFTTVYTVFIKAINLRPVAVPRPS